VALWCGDVDRHPANCAPGEGGSGFAAVTSSGRFVHERGLLDEPGRMPSGPVTASAAGRVDRRVASSRHVRRQAGGPPPLGSTRWRHSAATGRPRHRSAPQPAATRRADGSLRASGGAGRGWGCGCGVSRSPP
jgi:hypothetical protein